jgi:hypothetical protein
VNVGLIIAIFNIFRNSPLNLGMLLNGNHVITTISVIATTNTSMIKLDNDILIFRSNSVHEGHFLSLLQT